MLLLQPMETLKIKFDGATHQIDANTFINSLVHFTNIVQEVNRGLGTDIRVEIKINALEQGSFLVDLVIKAVETAGILGTLFAVDGFPTIVNLVKSVGEIYKLAKFTKGEKTNIIEHNNDSVKIENVKGDITYIDQRVYNIYTTNNTIKEAITQEFKTLDNDSNVTGFELLNTNNEKIFEAKKEDFKELANSTTFLELPDAKLITKTGMLNILSLSFEKNRKWDFIYEGNKISVKLTDQEFSELIDRGEAFAKGDSLEAEIEIRQEFNKSANVYVNKSYKVIKINKHIPRPKQQNLFSKKSNK